MTAEQAIKEAHAELIRCCYNAECGANAGLRAIYGKKYEWLNILVRCAVKYLEEHNENGIESK